MFEWFYAVKLMSILINSSEKVSPGEKKVLNYGDLLTVSRLSDCPTHRELMTFSS